MAGVPIKRAWLTEQLHLSCRVAVVVFNASGIGVNAWLIFYFQPFGDSGGTLRVNVVEMDRFVWPGTGQGNIEGVLDGNKHLILNVLQDVSTLIFGLAGLAQERFTDVYLLPGTQPDRIATENALEHGNAFSDVTIVLEKNA